MEFIKIQSVDFIKNGSKGYFNDFVKQIKSLSLTLIKPCFHIKFVEFKYLYFIFNLEFISLLLSLSYFEEVRYSQR